MPNQEAISRKKTCPHSNRRAIQFFWIMFAIFIVYGTFIPFRFSLNKEFLLFKLTRISWVPFIDPDGSRASIPDMVQNILLFIPFGFFGFFSLQKEKKFRIAHITFIGALFSLSIEILQLLTTRRITSVTDIVTNTSGTFIGALAAFILVYLFSELISSCYFQKYLHSQALFPLLVSLTLLVFSALQPFDFTLDVGSVWPKIRTLLAHPLDFSLILRDEGVVFLRFALFSYLCAIFFQENRSSYAIMKGLGISCVLGIFLEGSQLIVGSRMPGIQDGMVVVLGSLFGGLLAGISARKMFSRNGWVALIILATLISAGIQTLSPFQLAELRRGFNWLPFLPYYQKTTFVALSNFIESSLMYFPLGFGLQYLLSQKTFRFFFIVLIALGIAVPLEYLQGWILGRYPDITDIIGALTGTFAGLWCCTGGWTAFNKSIWKEELDS